MSRGSRVVPVRFPEAELQEMESNIVLLNQRRSGDPFTISSFIRAAVQEKLAHYERSRRPKRRKGAFDVHIAEIERSNGP